MTVEKFLEKLLDAFSVAVLNSVLNNERSAVLPFFFHEVSNGVLLC